MAATGQLHADAVRSALPIAGIRRIIKRVFDVLIASMLLLLFFPLMALLAIAIKMQDHGPAFYRRRVVGPQGEFDAFKLRSMRTDADELLKRDFALRREYELNFKIREDPRITAFGRFLRRTSLDELPQLWNVLKGQMSLVGPRMITPAELEKYSESGWIFQCVRPGMTGYWQIEGRQDVSYARRIEMDLYYVKHWSLALDFKILLKTPWRAIRGSGAY